MATNPINLTYAFDHKHKVAPMKLKDLLGGKGANLAEMTSVLKLPVPPGFTISTDACRTYMVSGWAKGLDAEMAAQIAKIEKKLKRKRARSLAIQRIRFWFRCVPAPSSPCPG